MNYKSLVEKREHISAKETTKEGIVMGMPRKLGLEGSEFSGHRDNGSAEEP